MSTVDKILRETGQFGKYQKYVFVLICVANIILCVGDIAFVFTAKDLNYRCNILECDSFNPEFNPKWLTNAIPFQNHEPRKCEKFSYISNTTTVCSEVNFDRYNIQKCDLYVYETSEITAVNDFGLHCEKNLWKLSLVGTVHHLGLFVGMLFSGILSDRYGRKVCLVMGMLLCGIVGFLQSFVPSYNWFIGLEFLCSAISSGVYVCSYVLAVELVCPEKRRLTGTVINSCGAFSEILLGLTAWMIQSWRLLLRIVHIPALLMIFYFWLLPESVRWLMAKRKYEQAKNILRRYAKVNGKVISENILNQLSIIAEQDNNETKEYSFFVVFKSVPLTLRLIVCCFCWVTSTFVYYGITLNSVSLSSNSYLDFVLTAMAGVPGFLVAYLLLDRIGRKATLSSAFIITGFSCFSFIFTDDSSHWLKLCLYMIGKFGITVAFTGVYSITSEMFPTTLRNSLMATCSTFARIGSMTAPQVPILAKIWSSLPLFLFASMSATAGLLSLFFPETLNTILPDTIKEAEDIGKPSTKSNAEHVDKK